MFSFGNNLLDVGRRELRRGAELIPVQPQVFDILVYLLRNRDRVVSKDELIEAVWGGRIISESTLTSRLNAVRAAVGDSGEAQVLIRTYARKGVRFVGPVEESGDRGADGRRSATASPAAAAPPFASPQAGRDKPRSAAILMAAAVGLEGLVEWNKERALRMLEIYRDVITNFIGAHRGRVVAGGNTDVIAEFSNALDAIRAAADFQQELSARNAPLSFGGRLQFGVGIAVGTVAATNGPPTGEGPEIAANLQSAADPGGICISASVLHEIEGQTDLRFVGLGHLNADDNSSLQAFRVAQPVPEPRFESRGKPTIAVLPFTNMSGDPEQEYFSDGITDDIITALSRHRSLLVIARNSTFAFKGHGVDVRRIGTDLGADYVIEGGVRKIGQRMRISAQLIETGGGRHLWVERYDRNLDEIF